MAAFSQAISEANVASSKTIQLQTIGDGTGANAPEMLKACRGGISRVIIPKERLQTDGTRRFKTQDGRQYVRDANGTIRRVKHGSND